MIILQNYGVQVKGKRFDTMFAHYVLQPELRHNMDYLEIYLHYQTIHIDELIEREAKPKNMRDLPPEDSSLLCLRGCGRHPQTENVPEELKEQGAEHLFYENRDAASSPYLSI